MVALNESEAPGSQLNETVVSRRDRLDGQTHFLWPFVLCALKPLDPSKIEERCQSTTACAMIGARPLASC
jgi:hypothetical protein